MIKDFCTYLINFGEKRSAYDVAKDFQTSIAAILALLAAVVALVSAQWAANKQRRTAIEIAKEQHRVDLNEKERLKVTDAVAALLSISVEIGKIESKLRLRRVGCSEIIEYIRISNGSATSGELRSIWKQTFTDNDEWIKEFKILNFDVDAARKIAPDEQFYVHLIATAVKEHIASVSSASAVVDIDTERNCNGTLEKVSRSIDECLRCVEEAAPLLYQKGEQLRREYDRLNAKAGPAI